jgi:3-phosphoshikimate 1-carboxyvinyltransferase
VEADWSAASYWYSMVALSNKADITLQGLQKESLQGDAVVAKIYENFGVKTEFIENRTRLTKNSSPITHHSPLCIDFTDCPDLAQTVAVTCAALNIPAKLPGLSTLRITETDRIAALQTEFCKLGYQVNIENDDLTIFPSLRTDRHSCESRNLSNGNENTIKTYNDHRMAMAFAPLALLYPIHIEDEDVVVKSYPNFWKDLTKVGLEINIV